jgi:hypothetical protein
MNSFTGRCGLCHARGIQKTSRVLRFLEGEKTYRLECSHCGMLYDDHEAATRAAVPFTTNGLATCTPDQSFGFDMFTLRILAARFGLAARPLNAAQTEALSRPHSSLAGAAILSPLDHFAATPMTLGVMCRDHELSSVLDKIARFGGEFAECIVVVDKPATWQTALEIPQHCRVLARNLGRDFGSQRNHIQDLSNSDWILQIDADEALTVDSVRKLRRLATLAAEQDVVSIGLPRKNFVGSRLSDLYPDVQYRVNRRIVRYEGKVHERPGRPWQKSMIAIGLDINHRLDEAHVGQRSHLYDKISPGNGRLHEEECLKTKFQQE